MNRVIEAAAEMGAALALESLGIVSGEMSYRKAHRVYGKYFDTLAEQGRIRPARIEDGHAGTKFYRVADILRCKVEDRAQAQLLNTKLYETQSY